jgi:hypothetical protein
MVKVLLMSSLKPIACLKDSTGPKFQVTRVGYARIEFKSAFDGCIGEFSGCIVIKSNWQIKFTDFLL